MNFVIYNDQNFLISSFNNYMKMVESSSPQWRELLRQESGEEKVTLASKTKSCPIESKVEPFSRHGIYGNSDNETRLNDFRG
jgi:hypothetical protein